MCNAFSPSRSAGYKRRAAFSSAAPLLDLPYHSHSLSVCSYVTHRYPDPLQVSFLFPPRLLATTATTRVVTQKNKTPEERASERVSELWRPQLPSLPPRPPSLSAHTAAESARGAVARRGRPTARGPSLLEAGGGGDLCRALHFSRLENVFAERFVASWFLYLPMPCAIISTLFRVARLADASRPSTSVPPRILLCRQKARLPNYPEKDPIPCLSDVQKRRGLPT